MPRTLAFLVTFILLALVAAPAAAAPERAGTRLLRFSDEPMMLRLVELRRLDEWGTFAGVAQLRTSADDGTLFADGRGRLVFRATYDRASRRLEGQGAFEFVGDIRDGTTNTVAVEARGRLSFLGDVPDGTDILHLLIPITASGLCEYDGIDQA